MTAPQNDAPPSEPLTSEQENSKTIGRQKLQRCWFVGMGLLGGFGFVTGQMGFALAETNLLIQANDAGELTEDSFTSAITDGDYSAENGSVDGYTTDAYTTAAADLAPVQLTSAQPTFEVQPLAQSAPVPEAFIDAPAAPSEAVASLAVAAQPAAELPIQATAPAEMIQIEAQTQEPVQAIAAQPSVLSQSAAAQPLTAQSRVADFSTAQSAEAQSTEAQSTEAQSTEAQLTETTTQTTSSTQPIIQIEVAPTATETDAGVAPTVATAATPVFTRNTRPEAPKLAVRGGHPLAGFMNASAVAAPLSAYASSQAILVSNIADIRVADASVMLAMAEEPAFEEPVFEEPAFVEAPTVAVEVAPEPIPAAVPDILPAPVAPAIVEVAPEEIVPEFVPEAAAILEAPAPAQPAEIAPIALPEGAGLSDEYDSIFVDPTDYSIGATEAPDVVISEQSTGCEFTVGQGQAVPNGTCGLPSAPAPSAEVANGSTAGSTAGTDVGISASAGAPVAAGATAWQEAPAAVTPVASAPSVNVGPVSFSASGIQLSTSAAGRDYLNRSVRPLVNLQATEKFIFPLAVPSPITSLFGFRMHPISGDYRFHAGTDIGAEQGTPVLAAQDGVVAAAESAGGYGLMVVLRHETDELDLESRYAHLAEMFVEAGKQVKKGDIIGLVGSTGNSTGPHLHFEMRQRTADGWVLVNADGMVQNSLSNLVNALNNPMETLTFNLSDFNLSNLRAKGSIKAPTTSIPTFPVGEDGIPFRPAQPNAS